MGSSLAEALMRSGRSVTVWNRTAGKGDSLLEKGARRADTIDEAVSASPLLLSCLLDYTVTSSTLAPAAGSLPGRTLVNLASGTPEQARAIFKWITDTGGCYLDAAIMATPQMIGAADTLLFYAGSASAFGKHLPALLAIGGAGKFIGTDPGAAMLYELAVGSTLVPTLLGFLQGAAYLRSAGLEVTPLLPFAQHWIDTVVSPVLPELARELDSADHSTDTAPLTTYAAGIAHDVEMSTRHGIDTSILTAMQSVIQSGIALGHGRDSISALIKSIEKAG